jgi:hypothetical protein
VTTTEPEAPPRHLWRKVLAGVLVVLSALSLTAGTVGLWARRNFLDNDRFTSRAAALVEDPAVLEAITLRVTDQLMLIVDPTALFEEALPERGQLLAAPLGSAVEDWVRDRVASFVESDEFAQLWTGTVRIAHEAAVRLLRDDAPSVEVQDGEVTLNLVPVIDAVLLRLGEASPELFGREIDIPTITVDDIPEEAVDRLAEALDIELDDDFGVVTVYDDSSLEEAQAIVATFDRFAVILLPLGLGLAALAMWLAGHPRRTLFQLLALVALGMVLIRRLSFRLVDEVAAIPPTDVGRRAATSVVDTFVEPLTVFAGWAAGAAAVLAAIAYVTGPYASAVSLRGAASRFWARMMNESRDEETIDWVREHRDVLLAAGGAVGVAILWIADLSWWGLLVTVAVVVAFEAIIWRMAAPITPEG